MRAYKTRRFGRWSRDENIAESVLCDAAREVVAHKVDADLGGYLFKKRVARPGSGKSGGYRTIVGYRKGRSDRVLFLYGFAKNERANITDREAEALSIAARDFIEATDEQVAKLIGDGGIVPLRCTGI
jgi:hypothetical protein